MPPLPIKVTQRQYGGVKAKYTKAMDILKPLVKNIEESAGHVTTAQERETLKKYLTQAEEALDKIQEYLEQHTEHEAIQIEANEDYVDKELKEQNDDHDVKHAEFVDISKQVLMLVRKYDQDKEQKKRSSSASPAKAKETQRFIVHRDDEKTRISEAIKPEKLSHEAKYLEYVNWHKNAMAYAEVNAMNQKTQRVQVSALFGILDDYLVNYLHVHYADGRDSAVFAETTDAYLTTIKQYFQIKYPKNLRIFHFMNAVQAMNETGPAWVRRLEGLAIAAEAETLKYDDWIKFKIVTGMEQKPHIRDKLLLKCTEFELTKIKEKINEYEATETMAKTLENSGSVNAISQYSRDRTVQKQQNYRSYRPQRPPQQRPPFQRPPFGRGQAQNTYQRPPAPTFSLKCRGKNCTVYPYWNCKQHFKGDVKVQIERYGHLVKKGNFNAIEDDDSVKDLTEMYGPPSSEFVNRIFNTVNASDVEVVSVQDTYHRDWRGMPLMGNPRSTPLAYVRLKQLNVPPPSEFMTTTPTTEVLAMFDSGATQSLMHIDLANESMIKEIDHNDAINIMTATYQGVNVLGSVRILVEYFGIKVREKFYVCEGIAKQHVFLSWQCGAALQVFPREFPLPLQHCTLDDLQRPIADPAFNPAQVQANFVNKLEEANVQLQLLKLKNSEVKPKLTFDDENDEVCALKSLNKLLDPYSVVFNTSAKKIIKAPKMVLRFKKDIDIVPYKCTSAIPTPYALRDAAKAEIKGYVKDGIIAKVQPWEKIEWCAKAMFVPKEVPQQKEGQKHPRQKQPPSVRLVLDNRVQNQFLERDPYPFQSPKELAKSIPPSAKVFIVVDLWKGYYQCPLRDEDQIKTTFMVHEMGCYKFLRSPQGCVLSGDHFNRITECLVENVKGCIKLIDDILIFGQNLGEVFQSFAELLKRCQQKNFTLHPRKLQIGNKVNFAGFVITPNGVLIDERKVSAIRNFKRPVSVTDMKSFVGLAVQFKETCPNLMGILKPLIDTTSTKVTPALDEKGRKVKNEKRMIDWNENLDEAFRRVKKALTDADGQVLAQYNPDKELIIYTDASRLQGYGWLAVQRNDQGQLQLVECGSATIGEAASRNFSVTEIELMAVYLAMKKMRLMTEGNTKITIKTDHQPLVGLHTKPIEKMQTKRLMRMMEKLSMYTYVVEYVPGKNNEVADCLSRYPAEEKANEEAELINMISMLTHENVPITIEDMKKAASDDLNYRQIHEAILSDLKVKNMPPDHPARKYKAEWDFMATEDQLVIMDDRVLVPRSMRKDVLKQLHSTHLGLKKTISLAKQFYFWKNMNNDIEQIIDACEECQTHGRFLPKETLRPQFAERPMEQNAVDLAEYGRKSYLIHADRYSGYMWVYPLKGQTSTEVQNHLWKTFNQFGFPEKLQSDNAGQFTSDSFTIRCKNDNITQVFISPGMSQSNGFIERMVGVFKAMVKKAKDERHLAEMVMLYNQASNSSGLSPSQLLLRRNVRTRLPMLRSNLRSISEKEIKKAIKKKNEVLIKQQTRFDKTAKDLPELNVGELVRVFNFKTKQWDLKAEIINKDENRSYQVQTKNVTLWRNRRFIKKIGRGLTKEDQTSGGSCLASSAALEPSQSLVSTSAT